VDKKTELTLKDMVFKASSNSAINDNGEPSTEQLRTVLLDGYRFIDLHVYMISSNSGNALYVANPAEPSRTTISASLPLSKALEVIQETAFSKPNNYKPTVDYDYTQDPLFIHFVLHKHPNIRGADMLDLLYKNYLDPREGKGLIPTQFWHMVQSTQTAIPIDRNTSFGDIKRKALFGFNVQNLVQLYSLNENADDVPVSQRRMLMNMCNFKTGGHSWNAYTSYNGLPVVQTNISENGMSTNAKQMNIVLPPPTTQQNPDVYRVLEQNQIQTVPVLVHLRDEGVDLVRELHNECKTSCIPYSTALARAAIANKNT
jgi:hypothetical protein